MAARNFFGNSPLTIKYQGKMVTVWPLVKNKILRDRQGNIYLAWWPTPDDLPKTPTQRERYHWRKEQISYRRFPDGLVSCERALIYATLSGEIKFTEQEELKALAEKVGAQLTILDPANAHLMGSLKKDVAMIAKAIEHAQSLPLIEAREQIIYLALFRDKLGRVNVGALRCRSATIEERLRERLEAISFWSNDYRVRYAMVKDINERFYLSLDHFKKAVGIDLEQLEVAMKGKRPIKKYLEARLNTYADYFVKWFGIKPYHNWIKHTIVDLAGASMYADWGEVLDVQRVLKKLITVTRYKMAQQAVDQAIFITADLQEKNLDGIWVYNDEDKLEIGELLNHALAELKDLDFNVFSSSEGARSANSDLNEITRNLLPNGCAQAGHIRHLLKGISRMM